MTLAPVEEVRLAYPEGLEEEHVVEPLGTLCAVPGCHDWGTQGHHVVPRRMTAGPRRLVVIDGLVVDNVARLCTWHHDAVTGMVGGHRARISWEDDGWTWWRRNDAFRRGVDMFETFERIGPLDQRKGNRA